MRTLRTIALFSAVLLSAVSVHAQEPATDAAPQMAFEVLEHDFGELTLDGRSASFDFRFTNKGTAPLVVIRVQTTCNCTKVAFGRKPVAAGESGIITVTYNPVKETGAFNKGIHIFTNSPERQQTIFVRGVVVPPDKP